MTYGDLLDRLLSYVGEERERLRSAPSEAAGSVESLLSDAVVA